MELITRILLWVVSIAIFLWLAKELYTASFSCINTGKISDNLFAVKTNFVNFFIYKTEDAVICFDAGYKKKAISSELAKLDIEPDEITHVFLTHSDIDHIGGIELFKNAKIYLSVDEEQMILGKTMRFPFIRNEQINRLKSIAKRCL